MNNELIARLRSRFKSTGDLFDKELADALEAAKYLKACQGIPRKGCNYTAICNQVCNKCGEIHHAHHLMVTLEAAQPAPQTAEERIADIHGVIVALRKELREETEDEVCAPCGGTGQVYSGEICKFCEGVKP